MDQKFVTVTRSEFSDLLLNEGVACIVIENDARGLTLAALDHAFENGEAAVITTRKPGTNGAPAVIETEGHEQLQLGDVCLFRRLPDGCSRISPLTPMDEWTNRKIAAARQEFLPHKYAQ